MENLEGSHGPNVEEATASNVLSELTVYLSSLKDTIHQLASLRAEIDKSQNATKDNPESATIAALREEFTSNAMNSLTQMMVVKRKHLDLLMMASACQATLEPDQKRLLESQLALENVKYEHKMLEEEIFACQNVEYPYLKKINVRLPSPVPVVGSEQELLQREDGTKIESFNAIGDSTLEVDLAKAEENHRCSISILNAELQQRKELQSSAERLKIKEKECEDQCKRKRDILASIPRRIKKLAVEAQPLSSFFEDLSGENGEMPVSRNLDMNELGELPPPLYVLAREVLAYRESFPGSVKFQVVSVDGELNDHGQGIHNGRKSMDSTFQMTSETRETVSSNTKNGAEENLSSYLERETDPNPSIEASSAPTPFVHRVRTARRLLLPHRKALCVEIISVGGEKDTPLSLALTFTWRPKIGIVTVKCSTAEGISAPFSMSTDKLCHLYPQDTGEESPNPANLHLLNGLFRFDNGLADGQRPFLWANMICGLNFPKSADYKENVQDNATSVMDWARLACKAPNHIRFKDVVRRLQRRMRDLASLQEQIRSLQSGVFPISPQTVGFVSQLSAKLHHFSEVSTEDLDEFVTTNTQGCASFWKAVVVCNEVELETIVGIRHDYPVGPTTIWILRRKGMSSMLSEANIREIERLVNSCVDDLCVLEADRTDESQELKIGDSDRTGKVPLCHALGVQITKLVICVHEAVTEGHEASNGVSLRNADGTGERKIRGRGRTVNLT